MLKIKLARFGKKHQPHFRIVINEAKDKRDGSYNENIGHYAPTQSPKILEINIDRYNYWISQGAKPTETVAALYEKFKSGNPFPAKKESISKKAKAKLAEAKKAEEEAKSKPVAEAPVEETPAEPTPEATETATKEEKVQEAEEATETKE